MHSNILLKLIFILASLSMALSTSAASKKYDIEILIFEDISNRYINSEQWPRLEIDLSPDELPAEFRQPKASQLSNVKIRNNKLKLLTSQAKKIRKSKNYRILLHKAWRQPGLGKKDAHNVPINASIDTGASIKGTVKIVLERYLHVYTNLIYSKPRDSFYTSAGMGSIDRSSHKDFSIKAHRRMRSREIHYLDHPLVGVLVTAVPVK